MAKNKLKQIKLVSADDQARPPIPGGWAIAVFDAIGTFTPDLAARHQLPISSRSGNRLIAGEAVKRSTYDEIEGKLVAVVTELFPKVSSLNGFVGDYVKEYFYLWTSAAEIAPQWIKALGHQPELSGVLARALIRDFALRLCYLESCERVLSGERFGDEELRLFRHGLPTKIYNSLITSQKLSLEKLAENLNTYVEMLRRLKQGKIGPKWKILGKLGGANNRLLAGIGFMDVLLRTLGLNNQALKAEIMYVTQIFFSTHHAALKGLAKSNQFINFVTSKGNLLLHPGLETMWSEMPDALWRAHLCSLQLARMVDLAQAYCQHSKEEHDGELRRWFNDVERTSGGSRHQWERELQRHKNAGN